jgi:ubiquinone biosynthesis protein
MARPGFLRRSGEIAGALGGWVQRMARDPDVLTNLLIGGSMPGGNGNAAAQAAALREGLERLGPVFIKAGQLLSTRPDMLPQVYLDELSSLHGHVPPMSEAELDAALEEYVSVLGKPLPFTEFDRVPIAAASLAQVHRARLQNGAQVAVKVRRRGVVDIVGEDWRILTLLGRLLQRWLSDVYDVPGLVEELGRSLTEELSLSNEAENLARFAEALAPFAPEVRVPEVHTRFSTDSVLVMELVNGRSLGDGGADILPRADRARLARAISLAYFNMFFVDGIFHADPHPGNILITEEGEAVLIDFGMIGKIERQVADDLVRVLLNFLVKDSHGVAHAFLDIGKPTRFADELGWVMEVRRLLPRYHGMRLERLNVGTLLVDLLRTAAKCGIQAPPVVALVCKSLANMDGSVRLLDPRIDVLQTFRQFVPRLLEAHARRTASFEDAIKIALDVYVGAHRVPLELASILEKAATGRLRFAVDSVSPPRRR